MKKRQSVGKMIVRGLDGTVNFIVLILLLLLLFLGCYSLWDSHIVYQEASASKYEIYKPVKEEQAPTFADLQKINPEVMAWLTINDTTIDYPVAQAVDNDKYINTDAFGKYSLSGSLFLDYQNDPNFKDFNSIIYGHHMDKEAMFGDLDQFRNASYFDSHKYGNLYFGGKDHGLQFFSFIEGNAYDFTLYRSAIADESERVQYLQQLQNTSLHYRDIGVTAADHIVLLSTCSSDSTNGRFILIGRLTDTLYPQQKTTEQERTGSGLIGGETGLLARLMRLPVCVWILIVLLVLLIIFLITICMRQRKKHRQIQQENEKKGEETDND